MKTIDATVLAGYNAGIERNRLREGIGLIEFERTKEILLEKLPPPPAVIYDIGGAYGEYAWWLASLGYIREGLYYRAARPNADTIAVFWHGGASAAMLSHLFNLAFPFTCTAMGPDYTGITIVTLPDTPGALVTPRFELLNDARHIQGLRTDNDFGN